MKRGKSEMFLKKKETFAIAKSGFIFPINICLSNHFVYNDDYAI